MIPGHQLVKVAKAMHEDIKHSQKT